MLGSIKNSFSNCISILVNFFLFYQRGEWGKNVRHLLKFANEVHHSGII
jgi:hypothetical protein